MLTGKVRKGEAAPQGSRAAQQAEQNARFTNEKNLEIVEAVIEIADRMAKSASQVALAWCSQQPGVTSPIFGARTMEQLQDNLGAADLELDDEALAQLRDASALELTYPHDFHMMVQGMLKDRLE